MIIIHTSGYGRTYILWYACFSLSNMWATLYCDSIGIAGQNGPAIKNNYATDHTPLTFCYTIACHKIFSLFYYKLIMMSKNRFDWLATHDLNNYIVVIKTMQAYLHAFRVKKDSDN